MRNLLAKARGYLLMLIGLVACGTVSTAVMAWMGWSKVDGPADFAAHVGFGTACMVLFFVAVHYGERLWRWLGLDAP